MILYHGSSQEVSILKKSQAQKGEGLVVSEGELLDAVYFTPDIGFAIAVAAMPEGAAHIDDEKKTIEFENPSLFDPERKIFIYEIDSERVPKENLRQIDENQYAVIGLDEIKPEETHRFKAEEVLKYYKLTNWKKENEGVRSEVILK